MAISRALYEGAKRTYLLIPPPPPGPGPPDLCRRGGAAQPEVTAYQLEP